MPITLEEFLSSCDMKRKTNPVFDLAHEFKSLSDISQAEIIASINSFKLTEVTSQTKQEKAEFAIQEMYRGIKPFAFGRDALKGIEEISLTFESSRLSETGEIEDYEGNLQKISKVGDDYYVFHDGENLKCRVSHPYEGYTALEFNVAYDLTAEFSKKLESLYYNRLAFEGRLERRGLINRGMIHFVADTINENSGFTLNEVSKLAGSFVGKTSFLHLAAEKMTPRQLENFINRIPEDLRKAYLELPNRNGRRVIDMVTGDRADIINRYINPVQAQDNDLANYRQNVHIASIHNSVDESFVRIANGILTGKKIATEIDNNERHINFDHAKLKNFTDKTIKTLQEELKALKQLNDKKLFEIYIKPSLPGFKQNYDQKIVDFTKFQIEKAASLIEDVISHNHVGTNYQSDVNVVNSNGLSIKEMIAISYFASQDDNKLIRAGRAYSALDEAEQELCRLEAKMKFIDGLYSIRRGYNLDAGHDDKESYEFKSDKRDENVCSGGTVNRLGDALNGIHLDVEIRVANADSVKQKIHQLLPDVINNYIEEERSKNEINLAMNLKTWRQTNKMLDELQAAIVTKLNLLLSSDHELVKEFEKDFSVSEISGTIARNALKTYIYPEGKITEISVELNLSESETVLEYYKQHRYSENSKGNYALTLDEAIQKDPTLIKVLIEKDYDLRGHYINRDGNILHIASDYFHYNDNFPEKVVKYCGESLESFYRVFATIEENRLNKIIDKAKAVLIKLAEKDDWDNFKNILTFFSKDRRSEFIDLAKIAILKFAEKGKVFDVKDIITFFPEGRRSEFINEANIAILKFAEQGEENYSTSFIIPYFPQNLRSEFIDVAKKAIAKHAEQGNGRAIGNIVLSFPKNLCSEFIDVAKEAIAKLTEQGAGNGIGTIVLSFPEDMRSEFIDIAKEAITKLSEKGEGSAIKDILASFPEHTSSEFIDVAKEAITMFAKQGNEKGVDLILGNFPKEKHIKILEEAIDEKGYHPIIGNKLPMWNRACAIASDMGKVIGQMHGSNPAPTPFISTKKNTERKL